MNENKEVSDEFPSLQKQLLLELNQEFGSILGHKNLCKTVAKVEKMGKKAHKMEMKSFNKHFERIVDKMQNQIQLNEMIYENNSINNKTVNQTIDNIIKKQTKVKKINESIVEKTFDLNEIKSEENGLQPIQQLLTNNQKEISFDVIKNQLKQS